MDHLRLFDIYSWQTRKGVKDEVFEDLWHRPRNPKIKCKNSWALLDTPSLPKLWEVGLCLCLLPSLTPDSQIPASDGNVVLGRRDGSDEPIRCMSLLPLVPRLRLPVWLC